MLEKRGTIDNWYAPPLLKAMMAFEIMLWNEYWQMVMT